MTSSKSIYEMVGNSYKVTLVAAFIPLVCGIYWKKSSTEGAIASMALGTTVWIIFEIAAPDGIMPPQFAGFISGWVGMILGTVISPRKNLHHRNKN